ncbi:MAG: response regulator transcription factor [bacterium]|nr:response regulator transcription factor [bacterium]
MAANPIPVYEYGIALAEGEADRMSILVVEDNPLSATVLETHLSRQGWDVLHAADGRAALEVLERAPDVELLITDIQMPQLDGLELITLIRARAEWKTLPILVATARASAELVTRVAMLGVRHMAVKPFNVPQIVQQVREVLRTEAPTLRPRQQVQVALGVDETAYRGLLRGFADLVAGRLVELEAALAGGPASTAAVGSGLVELRESASLAGADRVVVAIDGVLAAARGTSGETASLGPLMRELHRVGVAVGRIVGRPPAAAPEAPVEPAAEPAIDEPGA